MVRKFGCKRSPETGGGLSDCRQAGFDVLDERVSGKGRRTAKLEKSVIPLEEIGASEAGCEK